MSFSLKISSDRPQDADVIAYVVPKDGLAQLTAVQPALPALINESASLSRFSGEAGSVFETFAQIDGRTMRVLLVGAGGASSQEFVKAGAAITARLLTSGATHVAVQFPGSLGTDPGALDIGLGALLRAWRIDTYRTRLPEKAKPTLAAVTLVTGAPDAEARLSELTALAQGVAFTRELVAEPGNILYPESFVERCKPLADLGIELIILDEDEMSRLGMGALLGVAQGSVRKPRVLAMRWDGTGGAQATPVALIGKGVTFDTGGISLKPGAGMEDMKWDMGGAGAVAGAMKALAARKAKAHVVGICGLVENMPDGGAQRPGDIVTSMSGQTIEVLNTDAEGRLVLCDVISWVQERFQPEVMVDLATLTGAMIVSLGSEYGGLFSNDDDLAGQLQEAGGAVEEKLWRFPLSDAYDKMIDSPIADMKNIGPRFAGSITAAQFLKRFVNDGVKWAHLDIAGMVWSDKPGATHDKGATGYGVRLLDRFIAENYERSAD